MSPINEKRSHLLDFIKLLRQRARTPHVLVALCACTLVACASDLILPPSGELALVVGQETGSIAAVSLAERKLVTRPGPIPSFRDAVAFSSTSQTLYLVALTTRPPERWSRWMRDH